MRLLYLIIPSLIDHLSLLVNGNHRRRMKKMPHPYYKTTFRCDCGHFDKKFVVRMTDFVCCDNCSKALLNFANIIKHVESRRFVKEQFFQRAEVRFYCLALPVTHQGREPKRSGNFSCLLHNGWGGVSSVLKVSSNIVFLNLLGIRWYRVNKGLGCLYILEKLEIWLRVTDA